jgi:hypothetical protein
LAGRLSGRWRHEWMIIDADLAASSRIHGRS